MEPIRAQVHSPAAYADRITHLVTSAGLRPTNAADLALLVTDRDDPSVTDQWLVDSRPHLVVRLAPEAVRLGPFVEPGITACLRCVQVVGSTDLPDLVGESDLDPALLMAALGCAVSELAVWTSDGLPITWSSSMTLTRSRPPALERWLRHPHCGCSWGLLDLVDHRTG